MSRIFILPTYYCTWRPREKDEIDPSNKVWEENFPTADEHLDKMDDLEKNNKVEVVPDNKKPLTKDERLALFKESAEKKSVDDID